jgi:hypothetical protein
MENIDQTELFGKATKVFSAETCMNYITSFNIVEAKKYFLTYFAKTLDNTYFFYEPQEEGEGIITMKESLSGIWKQLKSKSFDIQDWFTSEYKVSFKVNSDPRAKRFYVSEKTGQRYINMSQGFLHKDHKPFESYPQKIKDGVKRILAHIHKVWNSGSTECFEYCLNWLSCACTGSKMPTALFLKSGEGTGKSIIVQFLIEHVIGANLGLSTSRSSQLLKFNSQLLGKILVCLEEMPSGSKSEWHSVSDYIKDLITGGKIDIEKKFEDAVQVVNLISLIILTNNENTIKFGKDVRRYMMCDVSHDYVGNSEYFKKLAECCDNKEMGEAFFMYLLEHKNKILKSFKPEVIPLTLAKTEMKERNSSQIITFIKNHYLSNQMGLTDDSKSGMIKVNKLKDQINHEFNLNMSTKAFCISLRSDIPIIETMPYGHDKEMHIKPISFKQLFDFYVSKGFWSENYDTFVKINVHEKDDYDKGVDDSDQSVDVVRLLKDENEKLKKEIQLLKQQLNKKQTRTISSPKLPELPNLNHLVDGINMIKKLNNFYAIQKIAIDPNIDQSNNLFDL